MGPKLERAAVGGGFIWLCACATTPLPAASTDWMRDCERIDQQIDVSSWSAVDDFDGDGQAELLSREPDPRGGFRLGAWDSIDGVFARVAEAPEPERGGFFLVHALELRNEPVVARGWGEVELLSWPELQPEVTYEQGSLHIHALDRRLLLISNRGSQLERPVVLLDPDTGRSEALAVVGRERQWTAAPGGGAVALFEHEGRHTLTWLWAVHGEASTSVSLRQFPWASGWELLGAAELDGDPEPELVGVRRGHAAVVDWHDDEWRWSKPILAKPGIMSLLGAAQLDANRDTDLMFWNPATLVGGCSSVGCSSATRLRELDDTNTRAFMDRAGTITWVRAGTISQLRCQQ